MKSNTRPLLALYAVFCVASAHAASFTISTSLNQLRPGIDNQGFYVTTAGGNANDNYLTGFLSGNEYRGWFSFDLSGVSGTVTSATLNVRRYLQSGPLFLGLFDVSTPALTLAGPTGTPAIAADLGSGISYGNFSVSPGASADILSFSLNANALADLNGMIGSGYFSIGAAVLSGTGNIFGGSNNEPGSTGGAQNNIQELVLTTTAVPEPSTFALAGIGATVLLSFRRRR